MSDQNNIQDPLTDHEYDGIQEYDNPLPTWWLATFLATIIFAFIYFIHYEFGGGPTLTEELAVAMKTLEDAAQKAAPAEAETEDQLAATMKDPKYVALGATVFTTKCASCHGPQLGGLIGPNLTDKYWLHGKGTRLDIIHTVREGVADKGMPPWGKLLSPDEAYGVVAFILSKQGSNPANAKAPQGDQVE